MKNNNPLGSHKGVGKCGAGNGVISILPPEHQSKIKNNFLFILFNTRDRTVFTNKIIFARVIDEIKYLQKYGITISLPSGEKQIFFVLTLIRGDNLGLHSMLGFNESIRSNFFCRFCLTPNEKINSIFKESDCEVRTIENYNLQIAEKNSKKS